QANDVTASSTRRFNPSPARPAVFLLQSDRGHRDEHPFPTRRSSDLGHTTTYQHDLLGRVFKETNSAGGYVTTGYDEAGNIKSLEDRKSTRLNSSHRTISYAVFCSKKKSPPTLSLCCPIRSGIRRSHT